MDLELDWWRTARLLLDLRSFSSIWYWLAVAVVWSTASHFVLGVPYDMAVRARRRGGQAARDFEDMVRINVNRILHIEAVAGPLLLGLVAFTLTTVGLLGFLYGVEFAQAVFLIAAPLVVVGVLTMRAARRIAREAPSGPALLQTIHRTRLLIQVIGLLAVMVSVAWGVFHIVLVLLP